MHQSNPSPTEKQALTTDNVKAANIAFQVSAILFGGNLAATIFLLFMSLQSGTWQIYAMTGVLTVANLIYFAAVRWIRKGSLETGGWMLIGAMLIGILAGPLLISGSGVLVGLVFVTATYFIASQTLQAKYVRRTLAASIALGILVGLTDFLNLAYRLQVPALQTFTPIIAGVVLLPAGFFILRRAWSGSLTISRKLLIAFGALGILALVVGVVANVGLNRVQTSFQHALDDGEQLQTISLTLSNELLTARRHEKDFLLRWHDEGFDTAYANYVIPNQQAIAEMRKNIADLSAFAPSVGETFSATYSQTQYEADLATLKQSVDLYELNFQKMVELSKERGFQDTGLEGQFRTDVHNIEALIIDREDLNPLVITMLTIRRHEKDYLLRGDQTYIDQTHQSVIDLKQQVASSDVLDATEKQNITTLADQYVVSFDALTGKDVEVDAAIQAFRDAAHTMEPLVAKLTTTGADMSQSDVNTARTNSSQTLAYSSITLVVALLVAGFLSVVLSRQISNPIRSLTTTAQEISTGNFELQVQVTTGDEIGTLAQSFNTMTKRLGQAFEDVRRRAAELATVAEVSTATSTILDVRSLLQEVVDLTKERFHLYHSHIYLLDEKRENLVLASGAGEAGRQMVAEGRSIPLDREQSLVARAGRERKGVTVNDVTQASDFLPNALLPDTRSELAVPMIVGDNLIGVFDVQSDVVGRFTDSDINIQTTLAAQLATSVQNVRSFEQSRHQAEFETQVNLIGQRIQRTTSIEETLQTAIRELGVAVGVTRVKANISASENGNNN